MNFKCCYVTRTCDRMEPAHDIFLNLCKYIKLYTNIA